MRLSGAKRLLTTLGVAGAAFAAAADGASLKSARTFFPGTTNGVYFSGVSYEGCASGETLSVASRKVAAFPEALKGDVLFCLDASDRAGWTLADGSDKQVVRIPSKYGSRFLTMEQGNWNDGNGWGTADNVAMLPPELAEDAELGATVLDFGQRGSGQALCFNAEGTANYVNLTNIGTIVTLRGTQAGGGWLLGGGGPGGYAWHRGRSDQEVADSMTSAAAYDSPFASGNAASSFLNATIYADGQRTDVASYTFSGVWDLLAVQPTAATLTALGLGMGDARATSYNRSRASGGFKVAETIVFNRLLTEEEIQDVLAYLRTKWLAHALRDYNGRTDVDYMRVYKADTAHNQPGLSFGLDVAAGETLTVWDLDGGRIRTSVTALDDYGLMKTGAGTLSLVDASGYGNRIDLREGTLAFPAKPVPTSLGAFPVAVHFDASAASATVETNAEGRVVRWGNSSAQLFIGRGDLRRRPVRRGGPDARHGRAG